MTNISGTSIQNREKQTKKLSADLLVQAKTDFNNFMKLRLKSVYFSS